MKLTKQIKTILPLAAFAGLAVTTTPVHAAWTPANLTTELWYDGSDTGTITEIAGAVSQWDDKSGNGNNLAQLEVTDRPTTGTNTIGGLNVIYADSTEWMNSTRAAGKYTSDKVAIFEVLSVDNYTGVGSEIIDSASTVNDYQDINNGLFDYSGSTGYRIGAKSVMSLPTAGTPYLFGSVFDGTNHINYRDGTAGTTVASTGNFAWDEFYINSRVNNNVVSSAGARNFGEIIMVVDGITDADREKIEGYLAWKWDLVDNLPADHTYKTDGSLFAIPEPSTTALLGLGGLALILRRRK